MRRLRERIGADATEHLSARETAGADAVAVCNALGLFVGEGRLVIVDEVERWKAADVKTLAAYLKSPAPGTTLALVAAGGVFYSAGAAVYALHRPALWPEVFGYHELFHALVVAGAACHLAAVLTLV